MAADPGQRGRQIENAACIALERAGLKKIANNVRFRPGELDLVMRHGDTLIFVEVRYRRSDAFGGALASVDLRKRHKLILAANLFLAAHPRYANHPCRFDVVEASGDPGAPEIHWIQDAFRADNS
ncbi:MAG: YraN family protein [Xanthomonadaceae bacterium]|jgi:putative endonuclease|nr:YraN family protein [Xanthomonadaceae bacterium]